MDIAVLRCSDEVKQTPDCPLKRTQKKQFATVACACLDTSGNDLIQSKRKTYEFLQGSDIPSRPYA